MLEKAIHYLSSREAKRWGYVLIALFALQAANMLLQQLLGLPGIVYPWTFIQVVRYGFLLPVITAIAIVVIPILSAWLWWEGGVKRAIAEYLLMGLLAFLLLSWLALYAFILWEGLSIPAYPWVLSQLLIRIPTSSLLFDHLFICMVLSYCILLLAILLKCFSAKTKAEKVFGSAHFSSAFEIERAGLFAEEGIVLGKSRGKILRLPGFEGVLVVAPTGGGKTTAIAMPNLLEWQGSGVFNDIKGELYRLTAAYRKDALKNDCYCFAPADITKQTSRYNPFFYVSDNPDLRIRDIQLIAETLIPSTRLGDSFWYQSSREIFLVLTLYLFETKGMATLTEIHDLSKKGNLFGWLSMALDGEEELLSEALKLNITSMLAADEKTQKNILKDFHSRMSLFGDPLVRYATSGNDFDVRELRRRKISIYIHIPESDQERLSPILTLFWAQLINEIASHEPKADEPYGVLGLMDEFGNMARINKLKNGMSFLRSYHFRPIIIVQYLGQIISTYGREDAKGFLNAKVKIAFAVNDVDDAQFFSKPLGTKTVKVSSSSVNTGHGDSPGSRSDNFSFQSRALMSLDELMRLPSKKAVILMESKNPIKANKCYWFKERQYKNRLSHYVENPS